MLVNATQRTFTIRERDVASAAARRSEFLEHVASLEFALGEAAPQESQIQSCGKHDSTGRDEEN